MPKCESCRFYDKPSPSHTFGAGQCRQSEIGSRLGKNGLRGFHTIEFAREICDREGDGRFVYFEPKNPGGIGAAFGTPASLPATDASALEEPKTMAAGA